MAFDYDAWRAAHPGWVFRANGFAFRARPVSWRAVRDVAADLVSGDAGREEAALRRLLRLAFPWRPSYWWRGDPVRLFFALEKGALLEARADFFDHLGRGATPPSPTAGTNSPSV